MKCRGRKSKIKRKNKCEDVEGMRNMGKYLNIGNAGFTAVRKGNYVDKTGMLSFLNSTLGTKSKLTCVSRPRRFGKSFAAQMICAYYDKSCDSRALFEGLAISEDCSFETYLNKYHVIYLDITLFTSRTSDMKNVVRNINDAVLTEVLQSFQGIEKGADLVETLVHFLMRLISPVYFQLKNMAPSPQ